MSGVVRLGAVSYLNVRPLVFGLDSAEDEASRTRGRVDDRPSARASERPGPAVSLRFDVPSVCASLLADGHIDLGMVPSITWLDRPDDRIVPGVCIGSEGPVASVALFTRVPVRRVRTIALDTSSRTSAALTRILCARRFEISPSFVPHAPDLAAMLAVADAALLIGDPALFVDHRALDAEKIDLGDAWTALTGLPFVWAFWSGRAGAADASVIAALQRARDRGVAAGDGIADAYCAGDPSKQVIARGYLRDRMRYHFGPRMQQGLERYYAEAHQLGLVATHRPLAFFE